MVQAHWENLNHVLRDGGSVLTVEQNSRANKLTVKVDRNKLISYRNPSLGHFLCQIHIWRCTAHVTACTSYYEDVTSVNEERRRIVIQQPEPRYKFAHAKFFFFLKDRIVTVKEYDGSNECLIQSWVERNV